MTKDTYNIINIVGKENFIDTKRLVLKKDYDEFWIDKFKINFLSNNHIKGSVAVFIEKDNKKILYTGDFSFNRQTTTKYVDENDFYKFNNIDYLITETTYGNKDIEIPYRYKKKLINYFINLSVKNNIKVIIPAFAIGRAQECYDLIKNSTIKANVLVDGLATKVNEYYGSINNIGNHKSSNIYNKYRSNDIIIASGGILNEGSASEKYYNIALKDKSMVTVLKCGYMDKDICDIKIKPYDGININLIDISLSAHATYEDLLKMVKVTKPKNLVQVHGSGIKLYNDLLYKKKSV
jgi:putative mRNA 3-end processing factor